MNDVLVFLIFAIPLLIGFAGVMTFPVWKQDKKVSNP